MIPLDALLKSLPLIHATRVVNQGIHPALARFLDEHVAPGSVTLETGAGVSTIVLLRRGMRRHIAVQPDPDQFAVIRQVLASHAIAAEGFEPVVARSQEFLPTAQLPPLDLVLIDGDHAFPVPFLDWYYTANRLTRGGLMVVDDIDIATGTILADFMAADERWSEVWRPPGGRFAVYRKVAETNPDDWWREQRYLLSAYPTRAVKLVAGRPRPPGPLERWMARLLPWRLVQVPLRRRLDWPRSE